jgi:methyl-accepting chemotaxis protein
MLSSIQEAVGIINSMNIQIADGANHQTELSENIRQNIAAVG